MSPYTDNLNLSIFLFITPMFLFSGAFFPLDGMPALVKPAANLLPLTHLVNITRAATFGRLAPALRLRSGWTFRRDDDRCGLGFLG
ncbi:MAG: ABC transporter permease [Elusimicrobia bacterium]|nr:ABC transporter permease [Elusimicrobiota bacterium]